MMKIQSVTVFKQGGAFVRYTSGKGTSYSLKGMPETAKAFILRDDVKAFENETSTMYRIA